MARQATPWRRGDPMEERKSPGGADERLGGSFTRLRPALRPHRPTLPERKIVSHQRQPRSTSEPNALPGDCGYPSPPHAGEAISGRRVGVGGCFRLPLTSLPTRWAMAVLLSWQGLHQRKRAQCSVGCRHNAKGGRAGGQRSSSRRGPGCGLPAPVRHLALHVLVEQRYGECRVAVRRTPDHAFLDED